MSWLRAGDTAATYPLLMQTATDPKADERTVNEVAGWLHRCMEQAASHRTDYLVDMGTAALIGGSRSAELIRICKRVKLIKIVKRAGLEYIEVVDDPAFLHVRLKAEQDWENQRKRDNANPTLTAQVRLRDGDGCRWCGIVTQWGTPDQKSARVGTYDHLLPGEKATVETMVVACRHCNSDRQADRDGWTKVLLPAPERPYYSTVSAAFIEKHRGIVVSVSDQRPGIQSGNARQRPACVAVDAPSDPAASGTPPYPDQRSEADTDDLGAAEEAVMAVLGGLPIDRPISADRSPPVSGSVGSGRVGSGYVVDKPEGRERAPARRTRRSRSARGRPR